MVSESVVTDPSRRAQINTTRGGGRDFLVWYVANPPVHPLENLRFLLDFKFAYFSYFFR